MAENRLEVSMSEDSTSHQPGTTRALVRGEATVGFPVGHTGVWGREEQWSSSSRAACLRVSARSFSPHPQIHFQEEKGRLHQCPQPPGKAGVPRSLSHPVRRAGTSCAAGKQGQASLENKRPETSSLCGQAGTIHVSRGGWAADGGGSGS